MSRFIDRIKKASQVAPKPLGFRVAKSASEKPRMLLVVTLSPLAVSGLADFVVGADAGLLRAGKLSPAAKAIKEASQAMPDIPWGGWLKEIGKEGLKQLASAGGDFVVFPAANAPLTMLKNDGVGKILEIDASLSEGLLRTIESLPVDAVFVAEREGERSLSWHHLMLFQYFSEVTARPLLVTVPTDVTGDELVALWEAGVVGVVVGVSAEKPAGEIKSLRETIDKLAFPPRRKRRKAEPLLPYISGAGAIEEEEEEEEEGE